MSKSLGTIGFRKRGEWQANTFYRKDDSIEHDRSMLYCKEDHTSGETFDETKWGYMVDASGLDQAISRAEAGAAAAETNAAEAKAQAEYAAEAGKQATAEAETAKGVTELFSDCFKYTDGSEFVYAIADSTGTLLWGIRKDGTTYEPKGVPEDVKTLFESMNAKFKELECIQTMENDKYILAIVDAEGNVLFGLDRKNGGATVSSISGVCTVEQMDSMEYIYAVVDNAGNLLFGVRWDGTFATSKFELPSGMTLPTTDSGSKYLAEDSKDMEFIYKVTDSEGRVLFGIYWNGETYQPKGMPEEVKKFVTKTEKRMDTIETRIDNLKDNAGDLSDLTFIHLPFPEVPARIDFTGTVPTSKYLQTRGKMRYEDRLGNKFTKDIMWNLQGNISQGFDKKNFAIDIYNDISADDTCSIKFGNWVAQDSFHIKAYYSDFWKVRSLFGYRLASKIQAHRGTYDRYAWQKYLLGAAQQESADALKGGFGDMEQDLDTGALGHPDGFPCMVYINGVPWGLYTVNIKKSKENYHTEKNDNDSNQMFFGDYMTGVFQRYNNAYWTLNDTNYTDSEVSAGTATKWDEKATYKKGDVVYDEETFDFELNGKTTSITIRRKFTCQTAHGWDEEAQCYKTYNETTEAFGSVINTYVSLRPSRVHWKTLEIRNPKKTICVQQDGTLAYYDYDSPSDYSQTGYYERTHEPINEGDWTQKQVTALLNNEGENFSKKEYTRSCNAYKKIDTYSKVVPILCGTLTNGNLLDWGYIAETDVADEYKTTVDGVTTISDEYRALAGDSTLQATAKKDLFDAYHDIDFCIDFFLVYNMINYADSITHNTLYHLYDGQHLIPSLYDLDISLGMGSTYINSWPSVASGVTNAGTNTFVGWLWSYHKSDIQARWKEYRDAGIFTESSLEAIVWEIIDSIGYENYEEDLRLWTQPSYRSPVYWRMVAGSLKTLQDEDGNYYHGYDESVNVENANYPEWEEGVAYKSSKTADTDITAVNYDGHSYVCTANHTATADNRPDKAYTCGSPTSGGVYDTPRRTIEWLKKRLAYLDGSSNFNYATTE